MEKITNRTSVIRTEDNVFKKALKTNEHTYFVDENEEGEVLMYCNKTLELISDNFLASDSLHSDLVEKKHLFISEHTQYNLTEMLKERKEHQEKILLELYLFTISEKWRVLKEKEKNRYVEIVEFCQGNNIEIPFGVVM